MNLSPSPPPTTHIGQFHRAPAARSTPPSSPMSARPSPLARIGAQPVHQPPWLARVPAATAYLSGIRHIRQRRGQRAPDPALEWPRSMERTEDEQDRHGRRNIVFIPCPDAKGDCIKNMEAFRKQAGKFKEQVAKQQQIIYLSTRMPEGSCLRRPSSPCCSFSMPTREGPVRRTWSLHQQVTGAAAVT